MKKRSFTVTSIRFYIVLGLVGLLILVYLLQVGRSFVAVVHHQQFIATTAQGVSHMTEEQHETAKRSLKTAIQCDGRSPRYHSAQGSFLFQVYSESSLPEIEQQREKGIQEAEASLKKAVRLDPGNAWNYYELARFKEFVKPCDDIRDVSRPESCPSTNLFVQALQYAPNNLFLRNSVGLWLYYQDRETAFHVIRDVIARYTQNPQERAVEFSRFLYDMRLDYESEHYKPVDTINAPDILSEQCLQYASLACSPLPEPEVKGIECRSDGGSAVWRTRLNSEAMRIKKVLCVPPNLDEYTTASLKVLMNNGGSGDFTAQFYLEDHLIKQHDASDPVPRIAAWYEIPFDIDLLRKKSHIAIYVRVATVSNMDNYLQIWGTQDRPTTYSVLNFDTTEDLSLHPGTQTGEYMIRLMLRK